MVKLRFLDMSYDFNPYSNVFKSFIEIMCKKEVLVIQDKSQEVDLEFVSNNSHFTKLRKLLMRLRAEGSQTRLEDYHKLFTLGFKKKYHTPARKRIWFTGENLRPPINIFDKTLTCDADDIVINNVFFPYWYFNLLKITADKDFNFDEFLNFRTPIPQKIHAVTFSSRFESRRAQIIDAVEKIMPVEKFGIVHHNYVASKAYHSQGYGFQICNENTLYPNYITEKLFDSWTSRNVPIWAGLDALGYFNQNSFIDVTNLNSVQISESLRKVSMEEMMYRQSQPLLIKIPDLTQITKVFNDLLD
jgi:hypothetical protein